MFKVLIFCFLLVGSFESFFERKISRDTLLDDSSDSVSSVHTSDLSSFDDEIIISSDEETGKKRKRTSLKLSKHLFLAN